MKKRIGLIDFGSNTFHLVIANMTKEKMEILHQQRAFVFLAQTGISNIADEAMERGLTAVEEFYAICNHHKVNEIIALGTAALRSADNSQEFTSAIQQKFNIRTLIIDGHREASLIYKGMNLACSEHKKRALYMDIGGGSTEFILTDHEKIVFQESFPIGLGVLNNKIPFSDPILPVEIKKFNHFLDEETPSLNEHLRRYPPKTLIGGSGTFDVLAEALTRESFHSSDCSVIDPVQVRHFISSRISSTLTERLQDETIPDKRVHLIIHAFLLILWLLDKNKFQSIAFSKFALKEGFLKEYYEGWQKGLRGFRV